MDQNLLRSNVWIWSPSLANVKQTNVHGWRQVLQLWNSLSKSTRCLVSGHLWRKILTRMRKALFQPPSHTFGSHWVKYSWCFSRRSQLAHVRNSSQSPFSSFPQHSRLASVTQCGFIVVGFLNPSSSPVNALRVGLGNLLIILDRPQMLVILLGILSQRLSYIYNRACHSLLSSLTIYA